MFRATLIPMDFQIMKCLATHEILPVYAFWLSMYVDINRVY